MKKPVLISTLGIILSLCFSCSLNKLKTEVGEIPKEVIVNESISIHLSVENRSHRIHYLNSPSAIERMVGFQFIKTSSKPNLDPYSGDYAITSNLILENPPYPDKLKPGDSRKYVASWSPEEEHIGEGYLIISLPFPFTDKNQLLLSHGQIIYPMLVKSSEQDYAHQSDPVQSENLRE